MENDEASIASALQNAKLETVFCPLCGKKFTNKTIVKHEKKCAERSKFLGEKVSEQKATRAMNRF